jgi:hypothetical protein
VQFENIEFRDFRFSKLRPNRIKNGDGDEHN